MRLSNDTMNVLKTFANINPSILIKPGSVISTVSPRKSVIGKAKVKEEFETQFAIYELPRFLGVLSLFEDPNLQFNDSSVRIADDKRSVNYTYADPSMVISTDKEITMPEAEVSFFVEWNDISNVLRAAGVIGLPEVAVVGDGSTITLQAIDSNNPSSDNYSVIVGQTDREFKKIFKIENLQLMKRDYQIDITQGIAHFKSINEGDTDLEYWIATEAKSS